MILTPAARKWAALHRTPTKLGGKPFEREIIDDFSQIEPYLPDSVSSILDIGCGLGAINIYLLQIYPGAKLLLLDSDGPEENFRGGYKKEMQPFMSRSDTEDFLNENGVQVHQWFDVGDTRKLKADLVISLFSWGWHYPLSAYDVSGFCIADLRAGVEKPRGTIISRNYKGARCAFGC